MSDEARIRADERGACVKIIKRWQRAQSVNYPIVSGSGLLEIAADAMIEEIEARGRAMADLPPNP